MKCVSSSYTSCVVEYWNEMCFSSSYTSCVVEYFNEMCFCISYTSRTEYRHTCRVLTVSNCANNYLFFFTKDVFSMVENFCSSRACLGNDNVRACVHTVIHSLRHALLVSRYVLGDRSILPFPYRRYLQNLCRRLYLLNVVSGPG
jgi:hypothetical protein